MTMATMSRSDCGVGVMMLFCFVLLLSVGVKAVLREEDRLAEYYKRGYTWPPKEFVPNTPGWAKLMQRRLAQVQEIKDRGNRYDGWVETVTAAYTLHNFTENGWALTRPSQELVDTLRKAIRDGVATAGYEADLEAIDGPPARFISRNDLTNRVLKELLPIHEAWAHQKLVPYLAYGFRLYQNNSRLLMHVDKTSTHIISCILHIDSSDDAEPWPIVIEDLQGNTNEVILKSGDMLLYESAKCFHGRPHRFKGSWYSSVFVHYYPVGWLDHDHDREGHYGVPPIWAQDPTEEPKYPPLEVRGTTMYEPTCEPDYWCALENAVKWTGPGEKDYIITTNGKFPLYESEAPEL